MYSLHNLDGYNHCYCLVHFLILFKMAMSHPKSSWPHCLLSLRYLLLFSPLCSFKTSAASWMLPLLCPYKWELLLANPIEIHFIVHLVYDC